MTNIIYYIFCSGVRVESAPLLCIVKEVRATMLSEPLRGKEMLLGFDIKVHRYHIFCAMTLFRDHLSKKSLNEFPPGKGLQNPNLHFVQMRGGE